MASRMMFAESRTQSPLPNRGCRVMQNPTTRHLNTSFRRKKSSSGSGSRIRLTSANSHLSLRNSVLFGPFQLTTDSPENDLHAVWIFIFAPVPRRWDWLSSRKTSFLNCQSPKICNLSQLFAPWSSRDTRDSYGPSVTSHLVNILSPVRMTRHSRVSCRKSYSEK